MAAGDVVTSVDGHAIGDAIVREIGVPPSLSLVDRWSLRLGALVATVLPWVVMPLVRWRQ